MLLTVIIAIMPGQSRETGSSLVDLLSPITRGTTFTYLAVRTFVAKRSLSIGLSVLKRPPYCQNCLDLSLVPHTTHSVPCGAPYS